MSGSVDYASVDEMAERLQQVAEDALKSAGYAGQEYPVVIETNSSILPRSGVQSTVITTGLGQLLTEKELEAVVAYSAVAQRNAQASGGVLAQRITGPLVGVTGLVALIYYVVQHGKDSGSDLRDELTRREAIKIFGLAAGGVAALGAHFTVSGFSNKILQDEDALRYCDRASLESAVDKIHGWLESHPKETSQWVQHTIKVLERSQDAETRSP